MYVVINCERVHAYLCMQKFERLANADVIIEMMIRAFHTHGGLSREDIARRWVCVGRDEVSVLQGCKSRVCMQLELNYAPFMVGIHCIYGGNSSPTIYGGNSLYDTSYKSS